MKTESLLTLFNGFSVMVWFLGVEGKGEYFNKAWLSFTGRDMQSELNNGWMDNIHPEDRERCIQIIPRAENTPAPFEMECRSRRYDGQYRWLSFSGFPYNNSEGLIAGYFGLCHDITDQKIITENRRMFTHKMVTIQEAERWRISRELHDEVGQSLTAMMINLDMLRADLPPEDGNLHKRVDACMDLAHGAIDLIRHLAQDLRPPALDTLGLNLTLEGYCQEFSRRNHIPVIYHGLESLHFEDEANITFYRFLQECLNNMVINAQGNHVTVSLEMNERNIILIVENNGQAVDTPTSASFHLEKVDSSELEHLGLLEMNERFDLLGGKVEIQSNSGNGKRLIGSLPLERK